MYSMIANLTRHLVSSANSTIAGNKDWDNCWIPITSLTQSRLEIIFSLTSGHSSLSWFKKSGSKCSIVLKKNGKKRLKNWFHVKNQSTHLFLPKIGDNPMMTEARADFTCWLASITRSWTQGRMLLMITVSWTLLSRFWQKSRTLWAAAARTSASQSLSKFWKNGE